MLLINTRCRELRHLLVTEVVGSELGCYVSTLCAMNRLEGEVTDQAGIGRVEALVAAVIDALAFQCGVPDAHLVDATAEAPAHIEVRACQCRNARFGQCLDGCTINISHC